MVSFEKQEISLELPRPLFVLPSSEVPADKEPQSLESLPFTIKPVLILTTESSPLPGGPRQLTWMRDRMLAKCVSIAPPLGKFWLILFIRWLKQL